MANRLNRCLQRKCPPRFSFGNWTGQPRLLTPFLEPRQSYGLPILGSPGGLLTPFLEPRQSRFIILGNLPLGLLTPFLEPRQSMVRRSVCLSEVCSPRFWNQGKARLLDLFDALGLLTPFLEPRQSYGLPILGSPGGLLTPFLEPRQSMRSVQKHPLVVCSPRFWNQGKANVEVLQEILRFAHPVFGTKAKQYLWTYGWAGGFAHPVFGTKAKQQ